jgi:hypothetical protein
MEQKSTSIWKSGLTLGVYLGIVIILYSVVLYVTGLAFNKVAGYVSMALLLIGIIVIQLNYKKEQGNILSYGQGVGVAVIAMISTGVISMVYTYLLYAVIDPDHYQQLLLFTEEQTTATLIDRGMGEDQIQMSLEMQQKFQTPVILAIGTLVSSLVIGSIASLITSIFIKKNPSDEVPE